MTRRLLAALVATALAFALSAYADPGGPAKDTGKAKPGAKADSEDSFKGNPKDFISDAATRQAQLKRQFESFKQKLAILANRLENGTEQDKEKAKALKAALKLSSERGVEGRFDALIRSLTMKGAEQNVDVLTQVLKDNAELRNDLRQLIALLSRDEREAQKELKDKTARLLEQLKELIAKQERVRAQTEMGRKSSTELQKDQHKVTKETKSVIEKKGDKDDKAGPDYRKGEAKDAGKPGSEGKGEAKNDTDKPKADNKAEGSSSDSGKEGKPGESKDGKGGDDKEGKPSDSKEGKGGDSKDGKAGEGKDGKGGEGKDGEGKPGAGKPAAEKPGDGKDGKGGEGKAGEGKEGKGGDSKDGKSGEGKSGESKDGAGKPGEGKAGEGKEGKGGEGKGGEGKSGEGKPGEGKGGDGKEGKGGEGKAGDGKEGKGGDSKDGKAGEGKGGDSKGGEGKPGSGKDGKAGDGKGGEGKPSAAKGGEGKPGDGKPSGGKPGEGKPGDGKPGSKAGDGKPGSKPGDGKGGEGKAGDGKPSGGKPGEGKAGEGKGKGDGKGEAKGGKPGEDKKPGDSGDKKPSDSKGDGKSGGSSGKPGSGKSGSGKSGGSSGGAPPPQDQDDNPVKKQIEDANKYQKQAEDELEKKKNDEAADKQSKAIKELEAAKKKLEDLLKQMREEEIERLLADLEKRCRYMLALQIEVRDGTVTLDGEIQKNDDPKKPTVAQAAKGNQLSDKEDLIVREADTALKLIENEGSAVAFAEVFIQVKKDMVNIKNRLGKTDTGKVTVTIENDVIETLKEMIDALKKAQKDLKNPPPSKPGQAPKGQPQDQKLIDQIAELKMIYAMQRRVNNRTELYGKQYKGEQAPPASAGGNAKEREHYDMIQKELKDLAERQDNIHRVTRDIATGKAEAR